MKNLAIIPARGQSKRLLKKNIALFDGKPLIQWTIEAAKNSGLFSKIHISTDCSEIKKKCEELGTPIEFTRPSHLAQDTSNVNDTITFTIEEYQKRKCVFDTFSLLQPTSPLRTDNHISEAYALFKSCDTSSVISVNRSPIPRDWINTLDSSKGMKKFIQEMDPSKRSQDQPEYFELNGALFVRSVTDYLNNKTLYPLNDAIAYEMPWLNSIDIDTAQDFQLAEVIKKHVLDVQPNGNGDNHVK